MILGSVTVERLFAEDDVRRLPVREDGLVGTLFLPDRNAPLPGLLVPHGGGCAPPEQLAASIAAYGFATFALQFCGAEGLPESTSSTIPLEYFEKALKWLFWRDEVSEERIGVLGMSTGGVVALVVGAYVPDIRVVVAIKSGGVHGLDFTFRGQPVPRSSPMPIPKRLRDELLDQQPAECKPGGPDEPWSCFDQTALSMLRRAFHGVTHPDSIRAGVIPVERIEGAVLLVSGFGDLALPSTLLSEIAYQRLAANEFPHAYEHLAYPGAGHRLGVPNLPRTDDRFGTLLFGGNAKDAAAANVDFWPRMIQFLRDHL